ncbi:probable serine/threonine-protein kinase roco11 [Mytilus californianus]|uniref:probable serine/threonine-protein kinase roco11 n=1 Tax=Mytilus californianus TaxID=6549 RepID=UPI0022470B1A|nr:probable serine/threonine-protein kinase roco11 [Mytilus californianus]
MENKYSSSLDDIRKADVSLEKRTKTKASTETSPVIPWKSAVEILQRGKKEVTPLLVRRETIPNISDENMVPLNESPHSAKEKEDFSRSECHSKPHIKSQEISTTTEVFKDRGIIGKLKKLFGVQKDVTEIKVSMTKDRFLKKSMKAGKKKLHQKKIAPVIIWDFGGQDVFYSTHQTFLTYRAIYLIVLDGSRTLDDPCPFEQYLPGKSGGKTARDYLRFWINTIVTYCKGSGPGFPKIMIVLTHKDKLEAAGDTFNDEISPAVVSTQWL